MRGIQWPAVMGIVNVTPDSFSDGGRFLDPGRATDHGLELAAAGAAVLDVGGESTRPGSQPVPADEQRRRVVPVIRRLAAEAGVPVSIDTADASVAAAALEAGATVVNDITAGRGDSALLPLVAQAGAGYVFMHMQGTPATMQVDPRYDDVVAEVGAFLAERRQAAQEAGIPDDQLVADPGLGFGKSLSHNFALLARLGEVVRAAGVPVLVGPSRKGFIGAAGGAPGRAPLPVEEREDGTLAAVVWALDHGASMVRVHDVAPAMEAVRVLRAMAAATPSDPDPLVSWRPSTEVAAS
jgi:dihydropteroate synthase